MRVTPGRAAIEQRMTLVTPTQSNAGDEITAATINGPVNALAAVINGNIDDTNIASVSGSKLASATVSTAKLVDASVTTAKILDASVTSEKLDATIACRAYRNAAFNATGGGGAEKLILDAENFDLGSDWDTTNGRFTAPVTGYYQVNVNLALLDVGDAGWAQVFIYVNGAAYSSSRVISASAGGDPIVNCSDLVPVTAGQYIEMYVDTLNTSAVATGTTNTYMSISFNGV